MSKKTSILVVDDSALLRAGLRFTLEKEDDFEIVGEASNGIEAFKLYQQVLPDVVTMDYRMPKEDGISASRAILETFPDARILLLSIYEGEEDVWAAWQAGVKGYLQKDEASDCIQEAIREVAAGERYLPAHMASKLKQRKDQDSLTPREMEVLQLIVQGCSNKEIMRVLSLSARTVGMHVSNMIEKLGVNDRTQAAIAAVSRGIVHLDPEVHSQRPEL